MLKGWNSWTDRNLGRTLDGNRERWRPNIAVVKAVIDLQRQQIVSTRRGSEEQQSENRMKDKIKGVWRVKLGKAGRHRGVQSGRLFSLR